MIYKCKVGCVFQMVVVSILPHVVFGLNDHLDDAPHFPYELDVITFDPGLNLIIA